MQIWFWSALGGAVLAGISNFYFKQAAARGYSAELFTLYGGLASMSLIGLLLAFHPEPVIQYGWVMVLVFVGGFLASFSNMGKVYALRFIDSTIYFPLFKLLAPALAILIGMIFFRETFSVAEWIGMLLGLLIPLMLITKAEHRRQNNLMAGLALVVATGVISATAAGLNKFATSVGVPLLVILLFASLGVFLGTIVTMVLRRGPRYLVTKIRSDTSASLISGGTLRSVTISLSMLMTLYAYEQGGTLAVVQTIHSMYILIPIVLAIVLYGEHWNAQKLLAIVLSVISLALLG